MKYHGNVTDFNPADLPAEVRDALEWYLDGGLDWPDMHGRVVLDVRYYPKYPRAWWGRCDAWRWVERIRGDWSELPKDAPPWQRNPWRAHHTEHFWCWYRRSVPIAPVLQPLLSPIVEPPTESAPTE